jgi:hypothetical protein
MMNSENTITPAPSDVSELPQELDSPKPVDVWYDDGNLIILAGKHSFRVYRGILSRASSVFRDMLSLAVMNDSEGEAIDGCPMVRVSDSAADMSFFLNSLHDAEYVVHLFLGIVSHNDHNAGSSFHLLLRQRSLPQLVSFGSAPSTMSPFFDDALFTTFQSCTPPRCLTGTPHLNGSLQA